MARQKLGQHFLVRGSILERIAAAACPAREALVIEIGPGRGALTEKLLKRADRVVAVELDSSLVEYLREKFAPLPGLQVVEGNALDTDFAPWLPCPIAGNLPYYAATSIIGKIIRLAPPRAVFLVQKEVALRLAARPGTRDYGYLSVETAVFANARVLFDVKPGAFQPPPKVDSSVVLLEPRTPLVEDPEAFLRFVSLCFRHKRKTIRNNLAGYPVDAWPEASLRAEQIPLETFVAMYRRQSWEGILRGEPAKPSGRIK